MTSKVDLRAAARARRASAARASAGFAETIAGYADDLGLSANAVVASYWPLGSEADPRPLARVLAARGHTILLPCLSANDTPLVFRQWREGDVLSPGRHGAGEPAGDAPQLVPDVVFVPLLAFDARGSRLGQGGGHYDRTLAALRARGRVIAIGIAYADQEVNPLPKEAHDQPLDMVLTERGIRHFPQSGI